MKGCLLIRINSIDAEQHRLIRFSRKGNTRAVVGGRIHLFHRVVTVA